MICLADNDIIHKLAACDMLDDVLAALSLRRTDVYVLPTADVGIIPYGDERTASLITAMASVMFHVILGR